MPYFSRSRLLNRALAGTLVIFLCIYAFPRVARAASQTTAWKNGKFNVDVQVEGGKLVTAVIEVGSSGTINVRNPWSGQEVQVVDDHGMQIVAPTTANQFTIPVIFGHSYLIEPVSNLTTSLPFAQVTDQPASVAKSLGSKKIGL